MWTFNILKKTKTDEDTIEIVVEFTKGANTFKRTFYIRKGQATRSWLEGEIKREISEFENRKTFNQDIKEGAFTLTPDPVPPTPTPDPVPTPDPAFEEFSTKYLEFRRKLQLIEYGILPASSVDTLRSSLITLYKDEYLDKI